MDTIFSKYQTVQIEEVTFWYKAARVEDIPVNGGACVKYGDKQIAVFNFKRKNGWYACQNLCPHKVEMVLARGLIGEENTIPKVACPLHKATFSLKSGECLNQSLPSIAIYPTKIQDGYVYIGFVD